MSYDEVYDYTVKYSRAMSEYNASDIGSPVGCNYYTTRILVVTFFLFLLLLQGC